MKNKKKQIILIVLGILSLVLLTVGVTYAFFNYAKEGSTENSLTTGTITFLYTETTKVGNGISLTNAFPISDSKGKDLTGDGYVFDFKITSTTPTKTAIPYEITARKSVESANIDSNIKVYLTKVDGTEEEVLLAKYGSLKQTARVSEDTYTEKVLYTGKVPAETSNYEQAYRLRMWVSEDADFSDGNLNNKTFTLTVNVYADAKVVTDADIALESNTEIKTVSVGGTEIETVTNKEYDYVARLPEGTTTTTIDVEALNEYSTIEVENVDSLAYSSNIKRLSSKKTLDLTPGDNYFKIKVTSENKKETETFTLLITVGPIDTTAPTTPVFSNKTSQHDNITLDVTTTDEESGIKNITCYYGDSIDNITNIGSLEGNTCTYPSTASYAKVCATNTYNLESCSEEKQLALYFIKNGIMLEDFTIFSEYASYTNQDGYINLILNSTDTVRNGIYTTNTYDSSTFQYAYFDASWEMTANDTNTGLHFLINFTDSGNWLNNKTDNNLVNFDIYWAEVNNYNQTESKGRKIYSKKIPTNNYTNTTLSIGKNVSHGNFSANIYNLWVQLN